MRFAVITVLLAAGAGWAQDAATPAFEVASVKHLEGGGRNAAPAGGGGTGQVTAPAISPRTVNYPSVTLKELIRRAYQVTADQVAGPDWMADERYSILAKMPDSANQGDIPRMLQRLLAERFDLAVHHEERSIGVYALVAAKEGSKLKEGETSALDAVSVADARWRDKLEEVAPGTLLVSVQRGHLAAKEVTMAKFADFLRKRLDRPVLDATGLPGAYSFALDWALDDAPDAAGRPLPGALQAQLGLRLDKRNAPIDVVVVDRALRNPTGN